jgi:hypothetical protein
VIPSLCLAFPCQGKSLRSCLALSCLASPVTCLALPCLALPCVD